MQSVKPVGDQVLVELAPEANVTGGGLHIPESARTGVPWKKAVVQRLGDWPFPDDKRVKKWPFDEGDIVLVRNGVGLDVKVRDHPCQLIKCQDVLAVVTE